MHLFLRYSFVGPEAIEEANRRLHGLNFKGPGGLDELKAEIKFIRFLYGNVDRETEIDYRVRTYAFDLRDYQECMIFKVNICDQEKYPDVETILRDAGRQLGQREEARVLATSSTREALTEVDTSWYAQVCAAAGSTLRPHTHHEYEDLHAWDRWCDRCTGCGHTEDVCPSPKFIKICQFCQTRGHKQHDCHHCNETWKPWHRRTGDAQPDS